MPEITDAAHNDSQQAQHLYLPTKLTGNDATIWSDVAEEIFGSPDAWLDRNYLQQLYGLRERSNYRWIATLEQAGLNQSLLARTNKKVRLIIAPILKPLSNAAPGAGCYPCRAAPAVPSTNTVMAQLGAKLAPLVDAIGAPL